jgi:hypothetical protein
MFGILVAIALIIAGLGFGILAYATLRCLPSREAKEAPST